jgi:uncharacterized protein (DUF427 family)
MARVPRGVVPVVPDAGQESVWDYPRPPALRASSALVVIVFGGVEVCRTTRSLQVLETSHPPTWYLPREDWLDGTLAAAAGSSYCEWKGVASYLDVVAGGQVAARAAWTYSDPVAAFTAIRGHVAVYPAAMDLCTVDGETVLPQPGGFYGGWITSSVVGPFKGDPQTRGW